MLNIIYILLCIASTCAVSINFIDAWQDIWIIPTTFIASYVICIILFFITLWIGSRFVNRNKQYNKFSKGFHNFMAYCLEFMMLPFRMRIKCKGFEKLPKDKKFLLVCNHLSNFDPLVTYIKLRKYPLAFISKPSSFKIPLAGNLMIRNGFIPINRENDREALQSIIRAIKHISSDEFCVAVYPEGTRNKTDETLLPFKSGCFKIATKTNCPVVVMSIKGTDKVTKRYPLKSTKVSLEVLDVLNPQDFEGTVELSDHAKELIEKNLLESENGKQ